MVNCKTNVHGIFILNLIRQSHRELCVELDQVDKTWAVIQFNFICIASITMQIVSRRFTETQSMTPKKISLTKLKLNL